MAQTIKVEPLVWKVVKWMNGRFFPCLLCNTNEAKLKRTIEMDCGKRIMLSLCYSCNHKTDDQLERYFEKEEPKNGN